MKVFFDTNVYVAEVLLGEVAVRMLDATVQAKWRIHLCRQVLDEIEKVLVDQLGFTRRLAALTQARVTRRAVLTEPGPHRTMFLTIRTTARSCKLRSLAESIIL